MTSVVSLRASGRTPQSNDACWTPAAVSRGGIVPSPGATFGTTKRSYVEGSPERSKRYVAPAPLSNSFPATTSSTAAAMATVLPEMAIEVPNKPCGDGDAMRFTKDTRGARGLPESLTPASAAELRCAVSPAAKRVSFDARSGLQAAAPMKQTISVGDRKRPSTTMSLRLPSICEARKTARRHVVSSSRGWILDATVVRWRRRLSRVATATRGRKLPPLACRTGHGWRGRRLDVACGSNRASAWSSPPLVRAPSSTARVGSGLHAQALRELKSSWHYARNAPLDAGRVRPHAASRAFHRRYGTGLRGRGSER